MRVRAFTPLGEREVACGAVGERRVAEGERGRRLLKQRRVRRRRAAKVARREERVGRRLVLHLGEGGGGGRGEGEGYRRRLLDLGEGERGATGVGAVCSGGRLKRRAEDERTAEGEGAEGKGSLASCLLGATASAALVLAPSRLAVAVGSKPTRFFAAPLAA